MTKTLKKASDIITYKATLDIDTFKSYFERRNQWEISFFRDSNKLYTYDLGCYIEISGRTYTKWGAKRQMIKNLTIASKCITKERFKSVIKIQGSFEEVIKEIKES